MDKDKILLGKIASLLKENKYTLREAFNILDDMKDFLLDECMVAHKNDLKN